MKRKRRGLVLWLASAAVAMLSAPAWPRAIHLEVCGDDATFLLGEPVVLRVSIGTAGMSERQEQWARDRTSAKMLLRRADGKIFPPLSTGYTSSDHRRRANGGFEDVLILQPVQCMALLGEEEPPDWAAEYLMPGRYTFSVRQTLLLDGELTPVESNSVQFSVVEPAARDLEAWEKIKNDPMLLRLLRDQFPTTYARNPNRPFSPPELSAEAFQRNIEFAREYIDTPYGQFAAVNCAMVRGIEHKIDLYPTLGRLIELRPQQDFVTQHARYGFLRVDSLLAYATDLKKRLADREEFLQSLENPPVSLRSELEREISGLKDTIENPPPGPLFNFDSIERWTQRLVERGEWPPDPEVRTRRRAIALGRED